MPGSSLNDDQEAGFTVIEVIVAFVIASVSAALLFQTFGNGFSRIHRVGSRTDAAFLAHAKLAEISSGVALSPARHVSPKQGKVGDYTWRFSSKPHPRFSRAKWLQVTVAWQQASGVEQKFSVRSLVVQP